MKITSWFKNIIIGLYRSLKRFPVTIMFSTAVAVMLITISELQPIHNRDLMDTLERITMILALGVPISLCIKLFFERKEGEKRVKLMLYYGVGALILILYYFFLLNDLNMVSGSRYAAVTLTLYLAFIYIPYLPKKEQFEMYTIKLFTGFFTTALYSVVLFLGLAAILFTVDKLLGVEIVSKVYYYTWLFVVCVFAPSYFLADIPGKEQQFTVESYPKLLRILVLYIVMPLLAVCTAILYMYFIKIIVTRQWPVGLVSHLVLWYSVIAAGILFFITPIKDKNNWADRFFLWFPKIILPILVMMFISMGIRINAYGVTENRYYVIVLGLWSAGIMIYFAFIKKRRNIILPLALSVIALVSVFGPLSSFSVSKISQNNRLAGILERNNMLKKGGIEAAQGEVSGEDRDEISRILDYFNRSHSLKDVKYLSGDFKMEDMERVFGFPYEDYYYHSPGGYFYIAPDKPDRPIDISGYDYMFDMRSLHNTMGEDEDTISAIYSHESSIIKISLNGNPAYEKELNDFAKSLMGKYEGIPEGNVIPAEQMIFIDENEKIKVKFIFMNISGSKDTSSGSVAINGLDFYMLVKVK